MTKEELNKLGFHSSSRLRVYHFREIPYSFYIPSNYTIQDIIQKAYELGIEEGKNRGKEEKKKELREALGLD